MIHPPIRNTVIHTNVMDPANRAMASAMRSAGVALSCSTSSRAWIRVHVPTSQLIGGARSWVFPALRAWLSAFQRLTGLRGDSPLP